MLVKIQSAQVVNIQLAATNGFLLGDAFHEHGVQQHGVLLIWTKKMPVHDEVGEHGGDNKLLVMRTAFDADCG